MYSIGGGILVLMMLLTSTDVILRLFGRPITGTYELISLGGAVVVAFSLPQTTRNKANVAIDFLVVGCSKSVRDAMFVFTKILGIILFMLISWYLFEKANVFYKDGFVTSTLQFPFYPVTYVLSICCLIECIVLLGEIFRSFYKEAEHE
jgi:TRAP-type C4-dicarboxylate transport system permease small subunit